MKKNLVVLVFIIFSVALAISACGLAKDGDEKKGDDYNRVKEQESKQVKDDDKGAQKAAGKGDEQMKNPLVIISSKIGDVEQSDMVIELYPDKAPNTVANFISLASEGFYDGLIFHRIIPNFMIQGGDPNGVGTGGPGYQIPGEFTQNGFDNDLKHTRGVISMARSQHPDSAGSQFFICHVDTPHLDGSYAAFGKLISGEDTLDALAAVKTGAQDKPLEDCVINKISVDLREYEQAELKKSK